MLTWGSYLMWGARNLYVRCESDGDLGNYLRIPAPDFDQGADFRSANQRALILSCPVARTRLQGNDGSWFTDGLMEKKLTLLIKSLVVTIRQ
jgi:hypothetical protein